MFKFVETNEKIAEKVFSKDGETVEETKERLSKGKPQQRQEQKLPENVIMRLRNNK